MTPQEMHLSKIKERFQQYKDSVEHDKTNFIKKVDSISREFSSPPCYCCFTKDEIDNMSYLPTIDEFSKKFDSVFYGFIDTLMKRADIYKNEICKEIESIRRDT